MTQGAPIKYTDAQFMNCVRNRGRATAREVAEMMHCNARIARNRMNNIDALGKDTRGIAHVFYLKEESK